MKNVIFQIFITIFNTLSQIESCAKGNRAFADLSYGEEDSIGPSTQIFAATKG